MFSELNVIYSDGCPYLGIKPNRLPVSCFHHPLDATGTLQLCPIAQVRRVFLRSDMIDHHLGAPNALAAQT